MNTMHMMQRALSCAEWVKPDAIMTPIIASGGLNSIKDVQAICAKLAPEGVIGAITGRALYEGTLDFKKAQAAADKAMEKPSAVPPARPPAKE